MAGSSGLGDDGGAMAKQKLSRRQAFLCPACAMKITVPFTAAGTQMKCPKCYTSLRVPSFENEGTDER
jgi:uncharacterized paraquat-inducible protein A